MSLLQKLSIQGIRSYGCNESDAQLIVFQSPITLILGQNGCGKTTIIECLKFVLTNNLPGGTDNGQGFVHDPKTHNMSSSKGAIKLELTDSRGTTLKLFRVVSVEDKGGKYQFTRKSNTMTYVQNGAEVTTSNRLEENINTTLKMMGISKPIVDNVIFCHQDESLWPLDSPKTVKDIFDQIFEATRYNKASDLIKKEMNLLRPLLKSNSDKLTYLIDKKKYLESSRARLYEKENKLKEIGKEISEAEDKLKPIENEVKKIAKQEETLSKLKIECANIKTNADGLKKQIEELLSHTDSEFEGTDSELQSDINAFKSKESSWKNDLNEIHKDKAQVQQQIKKLEADISASRNKLAQLKSELERSEALRRDRDASIHSCRSKLHLKPTDLNSSEDASFAISQMNTAYQGLVKEFQTKKEELEETEKILKAKSDDVKEKLIISGQKNRELTARQRDSKKQLIELENRLEDLKVANTKLERFDSEMKKLSRDLETLSKDFNPETIDQELARQKREIRDSEFELDKFEGDHKIMIKNYTSENMIKNAKCERLAKETEIEKIKNRHKEYFSDVFPEGTKNGFKRIVQEVQSASAIKIKSIHDRISISQRKYTQYETVLNTKKSKLLEITEELASNEKHIQSVCKGRSYEDVRKNIEIKVDKLQQDRGQYSSAKYMYQKFITQFESEKPCCPVCETDFQKKNSTTEHIVKTLKVKIQNIPNELQKVSEKLKDAQNEYAEIVKIESKNSRAQELKDTLIVELKAEIKRIEGDVKLEKKTLDDFKDKLVEPQRLKDLSDKLLGDAALLDQHIKDIESIKSQLVSLEDSLVTSSSTHSIEEIEVIISELKDKISHTRQSVESEQKRYHQKKENIQHLKDRRSKINVEKLNLEKNMHGKAQLAEQSLNLKDELEKIIAEIEENEQLQMEQKALLNSNNSDYETLKSKNRAELDKQTREIRENERIINKIEDVQKEIDIIEDKNIEARIKTAQEGDSKLNGKRSDLQQEIEQNNQLAISVEKKLAGQEHELRKLYDNQLLRKLRSEEAEYRAKYHAKNDEIDEGSYQELFARKKKLNEQWHSLNTSVQNAKGEEKQLLESIREISVDLEKPENKRVYNDSMKMGYTVAAQQSVLSDMSLYLNSVETAILTFHRERMRHINNIIKGLWREIYQGNDIDYIQIRTEATNTRSTATSRRSYDYKVVQVKNGVELEFRGRCSAGQKVLACLIVRIALAETFSTNCGILALDEPTTNLDELNKRSLSKALLKIIESRQKDKHFQLLVITHDEDFIDILKQADKYGYYYKVTRNEEGKSNIMKVNSF